MERVNKPWGYEEIWAKTDKYVGKLLHINSGHKLSLQFHRYKTETILVLDGILTIETDQTILKLNTGETYHVEPGQVHRFCCDKEFDFVRLIEVSTPELDDVVRLEDNYGRL
jgi:mannose-6-phosphate isomerase-like protein (cupin superfamily)